MPPFSALTTDEQREMKAELKEPGKYFVVTNPRSFELLPEYRDMSMPEVDTAEALLHSSQAGTSERPSRVPSGSGIQDLEDPDTIILKAFEEPTRRGSTQLPMIRLTPHSPYVFNPIQPLPDHPRELLPSNVPSLDDMRVEGKDFELLQHYRAVISHHLAARIGDEDVFETQAQNYPPVSRNPTTQHYGANTK